MSLRNAIRNAARLRREVAGREGGLYGRLLPDVTLLRRRGFAVHVEGARFRVGNRLMSRTQLSATAARERRLLKRLQGGIP